MLCILVFALFVGSTLAVNEESSLTFVAVLFRHGDRSPVSNYPNNPYDETYWPDGWGQLSTIGMAQAFRRGQSLRARYADFLSSIYNLNDVIVWSSDYDRCLMTAQSCLTGLFPPTGRQMWNPDLLWQPIPLRSKSADLDNKIASSRACPRNEEQLAQIVASVGDRVDSRNTDLYQYLSEHMGMNVTSFVSAAMVYDTLTVQKAHNLTQPSWADPIYPDVIKDLAIEMYYVSSATPLQQRLTSGPLLNEILQDMLAKRNNSATPNRKLHIYSGHDTTIISMWQSLGLEGRHLPGYTATLAFELYTSNNASQDEVKLLYASGPTVSTPIELEIPGCGKPCLLDSLVELLKPITITDELWEQECQLTKGKEAIKESNTPSYQLLMYKTNHLLHLLQNT